jgi:uncharacterized protein (TIGR04255 family)
MADRERFRPFTGDAQKKIRLSSAPLALVLCQVRWPDFSHLQGDLTEVARAFGSALEGYPVVSSIHEVAYTITPEGVTQAPGERIHQWRSIDGVWHISLSRRFASLYCTSYTSFPDFLTRLELVLGAIESQVKIPLIERLGVRYLNRVADARLVENLATYVRPEVLGYASLSGETGDAQLVSNANQARYLVDDAALQVRSGLVPAGETADPAVPPLQQSSWVLDLDASTEKVVPFDVPAVLAEAGRLSDIAYDFFKYISTEGFLREFGEAG